MRIFLILFTASLLLAGAGGCDDDEPEPAPAPAPVVCPSGRGDCDEDPANGCEADLSSSVDDCGRCSDRCLSGQRCVEGVCRGARARVAVCAGERHVCATSDLLVYCWGRGDPEPRPIANSYVAHTLACGRDRTCFIGGDRRVACWDGELGEDVEPTEVPGLTNVVRLVLGADTACALREEGSVYCWAASERPHPVPGLRNVIALSAAGDGACALTADGAILCWALAGEPALRRIAVEGAVDVIARDGGGCARDAPGRIYCWGDAGAGAIGDGTGEARPEPTRVPGIEGAAKLIPIGGRTLCAWAQGGYLCWGDNRLGQLGGQEDEVLAPAEPPALARASISPVPAAFGISCGEALSGSVCCWGDNRDRVIDTGDEIVRAPLCIEGLPRAPRNPY